MLGETEDYRSILDRVEQVQADCLFIPDYRAGVVRDIVLQLKARGSRLKVGSLAAVYTGTALQDTRGISDLVVCSYFFPEDESAPVHNFVVRYQAFTRSATPSHREAFAYDCLYLVARAIAEVGYDRAQLREYLNSLGRTRPAYLGISGEFTPSRQKESRHAYILEFRNGRLEKLR
ncbi:MAG: ABC transporter substrate-binding protein [Vulcanimicrobiota bacterium]